VPELRLVLCSQLRIPLPAVQEIGINRLCAKYSNMRSNRQKGSDEAVIISTVVLTTLVLALIAMHSPTERR